MVTNLNILCILLLLARIISSENYDNAEEEIASETTTSGWFRKPPITTYRMSKIKRPTPSMRMATVCTTPNNDTGYCIGIKNCTKLYKQLNKTEAKNFLRKSKCGPAGEDKTNPKVCCGKYGNYEHLTHQILPKRCGLQNVIMTGRIFGGRETKLGEFPWLARLINKNKYGYTSYNCGGFLIHPKYILTAAHCIISDTIRIKGPLFEVELGEHDIKQKIDCRNNSNTEEMECAKKPQIIRVKETTVHPQYDPQSPHHFNDIALVHLRKSAQLNDYVFPICLDSNKLSEPLEYWVAGWGQTESKISSEIKLKVSLAPFPHKNCTIKFGQIGSQINGTQICAGGNKGQDTCTGDSGSPLMLLKNKKWFAAGLVSYGLDCGKEGWPAVYTNVSSYLPWIKSEIAKTSRKKDRRIK